VILTPLETGKQARKLKPPLAEKWKEFEEQIRPFAITFSGDGKTLAAEYVYLGVYLWDVNTGKQRPHFKTNGRTRTITVTGNDQRLAMTADGGVLAMGWGDQVRLWQTATGKE